MSCRGRCRREAGCRSGCARDAGRGAGRRTSAPRCAPSSTARRSSMPCGPAFSCRSPPTSGSRAAASAGTGTSPDCARSHHALAFELHHPEQALGSPLHDPDRAFLKFNNFLDHRARAWLVAPGDASDQPRRPAVRDADRAGRCRPLRRRPDPFPARWLDAGFAGVLARGTPVAQCIPVRREAWSWRSRRSKATLQRALPRSRTRSPPRPASTASAIARPSPDPPPRTAGAARGPARRAARPGAAPDRTPGGRWHR